MKLPRASNEENLRNLGYSTSPVTDADEGSSLVSKILRPQVKSEIDQLLSWESETSGENKERAGFSTFSGFKMPTGLGFWSPSQGQVSLMRNSKRKSKSLSPNRPFFPPRVKRPEASKDCSSIDDMTKTDEKGKIRDISVERRSRQRLFMTDNNTEAAKENKKVKIKEPPWYSFSSSAFQSKKIPNPSFFNEKTLPQHMNREKNDEGIDEVSHRWKPAGSNIKPSAEPKLIDRKKSPRKEASKEYSTSHKIHKESSGSVSPMVNREEGGNVPKLTSTPPYNTDIPLSSKSALNRKESDLSPTLLIPVNQFKSTETNPKTSSRPSPKKNTNNKTFSNKSGIPSFLALRGEPEPRDELKNVLPTNEVVVKGSQDLCDISDISVLTSLEKTSPLAPLKQVINPGSNVFSKSFPHTRGDKSHPVQAPLVVYTTNKDSVDYKSLSLLSSKNTLDSSGLVRSRPQPTSSGRGKVLRGRVEIESPCSVSRSASEPEDDLIGSDTRERLKRERLQDRRCPSGRGTFLRDRQDNLVKSESPLSLSKSTDELEGEEVNEPVGLEPMRNLNELKSSALEGKNKREFTIASRRIHREVISSRQGTVLRGRQNNRMQSESPWSVPRSVSDPEEEANDDDDHNKLEIQNSSSSVEETFSTTDGFFDLKLKQVAASSQRDSTSSGRGNALRNCLNKRTEPESPWSVSRSVSEPEKNTSEIRSSTRRHPRPELTFSALKVDPPKSASSGPGKFSRGQIEAESPWSVSRSADESEENEGIGEQQFAGENSSTSIGDLKEIISAMSLKGRRHGNRDVFDEKKRIENIYKDSKKRSVSPQKGRKFPRIIKKFKKSDPSKKLEKMSSLNVPYNLSDSESDHNNVMKQRYRGYKNKAKYFINLKSVSPWSVEESSDEESSADKYSKKDIERDNKHNNIYSSSGTHRELVQKGLEEKPKQSSKSTKSGDKSGESFERFSPQRGRILPHLDKVIKDQKMISQENQGFLRYRNERLEATKNLHENISIFNKPSPKTLSPSFHNRQRVSDESKLQKIRDPDRRRVGEDPSFSSRPHEKNKLSQRAMDILQGQNNVPSIAKDDKILHKDKNQFLWSVAHSPDSSFGSSVSDCKQGSSNSSIDNNFVVNNIISSSDLTPSELNKQGTIKRVTLAGSQKSETPINRTISGREQTLKNLKKTRSSTAGDNHFNSSSRKDFRTTTTDKMSLNSVESPFLAPPMVDPRPRLWSVDSGSSTNSSSEDFPVVSIIQLENPGFGRNAQRSTGLNRLNNPVHRTAKEMLGSVSKSEGKRPTAFGSTRKMGRSELQLETKSRSQSSHPMRGASGDFTRGKLRNMGEVARVKSWQEKVEDARNGLKRDRVEVKSIPFRGVSVENEWSVGLSSESSVSNEGRKEDIKIFKGYTKVGKMVNTGEIIIPNTERKTEIKTFRNHHTAHDDAPAGKSVDILTPKRDLFRHTLSNSAVLRKANEKGNKINSDVSEDKNIRNERDEMRLDRGIDGKKRVKTESKAQFFLTHELRKPSIKTTKEKLLNPKYSSPMNISRGVQRLFPATDEKIVFHKPSRWTGLIKRMNHFNSSPPRNSSSPSKSNHFEKSPRIDRIVVKLSSSLEKLGIFNQKTDSLAVSELDSAVSPQRKMLEKVEKEVRERVFQLEREHRVKIISPSDTRILAKAAGEIFSAAVELSEDGKELQAQPLYKNALALMELTKIPGVKKVRQNIVKETFI